MPSDRKTSVRHRLTCLLLVGALGALAGCGAGSRDPEHERPVQAPAPTGTTARIGSENLAYLWPLKVDRGTLECRAGEKAVFVGPGGRAYALNDRAAEAGIPSIDPLREQGSGGGKISLGALTSRALSLCGQS